MYYYISEPPIKSDEQRKVDEIKSILSTLGIAGEFATASPSKTVEEYLVSAFRKGFSTIVGIGHDELATKIASCLWFSQYERAVMGFIPLSISQTLAKMVGTSSIKESCELLRVRLIKDIDCLVLNQEVVAITDLRSSVQTKCSFRLRFKKIELTGSYTDLIAKPNGEVILFDRQFMATGHALPIWQRLWRNEQQPDLARTQFQANSWSLETIPSQSVMVGEAVLAETPLTVLRQIEALKFITKRAKLSAE